MDECSSDSLSDKDQAITHLKTALEKGVEWPTALLEAMALWTAPEEVYEGTRLVYLIGSEAFDWLTLACRLTSEVRDLIPTDELEEMLFTGRLPSYVEDDDFKETLGVDKYSAYLNFFYGIEVETALQHVVELEVEKRFYASGRQFSADHADTAFQRIYRAPWDDLLAAYREDQGIPATPAASLTELKGFTYWLFKRRLRVSDKAKIASDTQKGIAALDSAIDVPDDIGALAL